MSDGSETVPGASRIRRQLQELDATLVKERVLVPLWKALQLLVWPLEIVLTPFTRGYNYLFGRYLGRANGLQLFTLFAFLLLLLSAPSWSWNFAPPVTIVFVPLDWFVEFVGLEGWATSTQLRYLGVACIWAIFAMAWDIQSGYTGYISFGHSVLSGTAGYVVAMAVSHVQADPAGGSGVEFTIVLLFGVAVALLVAAVLYLLRETVVAIGSFLAIAGIGLLVALFGPSVVGETFRIPVQSVLEAVVLGSGNELAIVIGAGFVVGVLVAGALYRFRGVPHAILALVGFVLVAAAFAASGHPLVDGSLRTGLLAVLVTVVVGLLIAVPSLRLKGPYFSLITFVAVLLLFRFTEAFNQWTNGLRGLRVDVWTYDPALRYLYVLAPMLIVALLLTVISRSNVGTVFTAIRENEEAVSAAGLNATKFKIWSFVLSSIPMGIGGVLLARYSGGVNPNDMIEVSNSIEMIAMAVIGGMSSILGALGGAFLFIFLERDFLENVLHIGEGLHWLALWILVLVVLVFARLGLFRLLWHFLGALGGDRG